MLKTIQHMSDTIYWFFTKHTSYVKGTTHVCHEKVESPNSGFNLNELANKQKFEIKHKYM